MRTASYGRLYQAVHVAQSTAAPGAQALDDLRAWLLHPRAAMRLSTCLPALGGVLLLAAIGCSTDKKKEPPPTVTSVMPDPICSDGTTFVIKGANFDPNAAVTVDGNPVQNVVVTDAMDIMVTVAANTATAGDHP